MYRWGGAGVAYSYFSNLSDTVENTFSVVKGGRGNDKGEIIESDWDEEAEHDFVPGATVSKSPQFKNTALYPVYVYMEVSVPNMEEADAGKIQVDGTDLEVGDDLVELGDIDSNWKYLGIKRDAGKTYYLYGYKQAVENDSMTEPLFIKFNVLDYTKYLSDKELSLDITARCVQTEGQSVPSLEGYKVFSDGLDFKATEGSLLSKAKFRIYMSKNATQFVKSVEAPLESAATYDISEAQDGSLLTWYDNVSTIQYWYSPTGASTIVLPEDSSELFSGYTKLKHIDTSSFDTSNVTTMDEMFKANYALENIDLSSFDTSKVIKMPYMFEKCTGLQTLDLSSFDTSNVDVMTAMFMDCTNLSELNLTGFDTRNTKNMMAMFQGCKSIESLDLSSFDTSNVITMMSMFSGCTSLIYVNYGDNFVKSDKANSNSAAWMFYDTNCNKPDWY